ncbi:MAG: arginine repressor [Coxiellaceae bacterium]|jgi:transcriptional regulator of arginine metabolism|nr:arginine repressor [Coxiellaceae bacterium]
MKASKEDLVPVLRDLLLENNAKTQEEVCLALAKYGFRVNQTKISRLLRKLGVTKVKNERGEVTYWLPKEAPPASLSTSVGNLIISIVANETIIVIHTSPGAASVIARVIDYSCEENETLGTIAGDDTIFVVPKSIANIKRVYKKIKSELWGGIKGKGI